MKARLQRLFAFRLPVWTYPFVLLALCTVSYSLMIRTLGYYWDDWPFIWISQKLGSDGLIRYFSTNRPIWGLFFQFTTPLLGYEPWHWHLFALLWRWIAAIVLWLMIRQVWPRYPQPAMWVSLFFAVYPGFQEQLIALVFSHFFIVLSAFFASILFTILAFRRPKHYLLFTLLAILLSLGNLLSMEYFFLLELLRPALLWVVITESQPTLKQRFVKTFKHSLPYLLLFLGVVVWRAFFFSFQTTNYNMLLLDNLKTQPLRTISNLVLTIINDMFLTSFGAWERVFIFPNPVELGRRTTLATIALVICTSVGLIFFLLLSPRSTQTGKQKSPPWALPVLLIGLLGLFIAGWPYWLIDLPVSLDFPNSRVTLSFMLGASMLMAGLLGLLPIRYWSKAAILGILLALAAGVHFQNANTFRRDGNVQKALFWQMTWRIPALKPGTSLLINELPLHYSTDNSLTATLNWIYAPDNSSDRMDYYLYYPSMRLNVSLPPLEVKQSFEQDYLAAKFYGSTAQLVALTFNPPGCLRVLDPQIEPFNIMLPKTMRYAAEHSTTNPILNVQEGHAAALQAELFGQEPPHGWCYYFQKADLARQLGEWQQVADLGDQAFALDDYPNDPIERLPFIEGYAHVSSWARALELTQETMQVTDLMQPLLCRLWQRIDAQTDSSAEKEVVLKEVENLLQCSTQ